MNKILLEALAWTCGSWLAIIIVVLAYWAWDSRRQNRERL
jgi:hypothetical protein